MSNLVHLIYSSAATTRISSAELLSLLEKSRANNATIDVTGMLLFVEGSFLQVLEGEGEVVDQLFDRIAGDGRHGDIVTIIREPIARRDFSDWSMGLARMTTDELSSVDGLNDFFDDHHCFDELGPGRTKKLLKAFRGGRWRSRVTIAQREPVPAPSHRGNGDESITNQPTPDQPSAESSSLDRSSITFAFQPIVDVVERTIVSHEAFQFDRSNGSILRSDSAIRSTDPTASARRQLESHLMAIDMAAQLGLSTGLTLNFAVHPCEAAEQMMLATLEGANSAGIDPGQITLELNHDQVVEDPVWFASMLREHRAVGIRVSIDRFGAGRSSHGLIESYQPDGIALSEGLVRGIEANGSRQAIVRGILQTALDLGIDVVAKNIETRTELDWFTSEGVEIFQGPLFCQPALECLVDHVAIPSPELA